MHRFAVIIGDHMHRNFPDTELVLCGDDDVYNEKNSGREYAEKAPVARVVFPTFETEDKENGKACKENGFPCIWINDDSIFELMVLPELEKMKSQ